MLRLRDLFGGHPGHFGDRGGKAFLVEAIELIARLPDLDDPPAAVLALARGVNDQSCRRIALGVELLVDRLVPFLINALRENVYHSVCHLFLLSDA